LFPDSTSPGGQFANGTLVRLTITRDAATDTVLGYINGTQVYTTNDSGGAGLGNVANNILTFFADDNSTRQSEASPGFVKHIRIWDNVLSAAQVAALGGPKPVTVPEPSAVALLGLGGAGLAARMRRRQVA